MASVTPLIVITGPTASGKSRLAMEIAEKWDGEIICADSRTVYKGMDIGTAKPTKLDQKNVQHWLLDMVEPGVRFTAADFKIGAEQAINNIRSRLKIPILVGGTGLYIDAVVLNFVFGSDVDIERRKELEKLTVDELISLHNNLHIALPENVKNKRYLIRSYEKHNDFTSRNERPDNNTKVFAIRTDTQTLRENISRRVESMFINNVVFETQQLIDKYGQNSEAMTGNIYRIVQQLIDGIIDEPTAKGLCKTADWRLAKRQMTWLRRHEYVQWATLADARRAIETILRKHRDG